MNTDKTLEASRAQEFGDFFDCLEIFYVSVHNLAKGKVVESATRLQQLREYIVGCGDPKSYTWLLPAINAALGKTW